MMRTTWRWGWLVAAFVVAGCLCFHLDILYGEQNSAKNKKVYYIYVTAESEDEVSVIRFDAVKATVAKTIAVGELPTEIEGPHGLTIGPDGKHWYLSMAHGRPFGYVYKYTTGTDKLVGKVTLGLFPATMQISSATGLLYVVNFNLHGEMKPSTVSIVDPEALKEVARVTTGAMPHGSRLTLDGRRHYSCAMMSGELFEIDAVSFKIKRKLSLERHHSKKPGATEVKRPPKAKGHHRHSKSKPTWVQPHPDGKRVFVACNGTNEVVEVSLKDWKITRRFPTAPGPYNVEISPDGKKMVVTYKGSAATGFWDLHTGKEIKKVANSRAVTHGVVISPDNRFAFVSVEGKGDQPGAVDVFDLQSYERVSTAEVGKQAGGIAFWKIVNE